MNRARLAAALLLPCLCWPSVQAAESPGNLDAQREALRARIERLRAELGESEDDRNEARAELRDSERAISASNRSLRELARRRDGVQATLAALAANKRRIGEAVARLERDISRAIAGLYVAGEPGYLKLLLSGQDPNQTARQLHYLAYVSRAHTALAGSLRGELAGLARLEEQVREAAAEAAAIERAQRDERDELLRQQAQRRTVLERISGRIRAGRREVQVLEADEARLARLVERVSAIARAAPGAPARRPRDEVRAAPGASGRLAALPVAGTVTQRFGAARAEGGPPWKGMFIQAAPGTEVKAPAAGQVVFADWMRAYGNLLILDHGGGFMTIYANNEALLKSVGDRVAASEAIATVGASGGGQQTGLYFELRHEGKAVDPTTWTALRSAFR